MSDAPCPWDGYAPPTIAFCEERICAWVVEPSNAWSNLAFVIVGVLIHAGFRRRLTSPMHLVGAAAICIGLGSFAFHATGIFIGEVLDVSAMYLMSGLFVVFACQRMFGWTTRKLVAVYVLLWAVSTFLLVTVQVTGIPVFSLQLLVAVALEIGLYRKRASNAVYRDFVIMVGVFAAAFGIWILDITGVVCDPHNHLLTGHAVWHILDAVCLVFFVRFQAQFES